MSYPEQVFINLHVYIKETAGSCPFLSAFCCNNSAYQKKGIAEVTLFIPYSIHKGEVEIQDLFSPIHVSNWNTGKYGFLFPSFTM